jgi:CMP-N,N'-diacetyllegionaminic acid synthase
MPIETVAIVPARGGSKGLVRKNLRQIAGTSLVARAIQAGIGAARVDAIYVSTEDQEIAQEARRQGADVIERPAKLATDTAQNNAVLHHALQTIGEQGHKPKILVLLQPTSPFRQASHIDEALDLFTRTRAASVISVCEVDHHPGKAVQLADGLLEPFTNDRDMEARRQDMTRVYRQNGAIYITYVDDFLESDRLFRRPCQGYVMDRRDSIDIDDEFDLQFAEFIARTPLR